MKKRYIFLPLMIVILLLSFPNCFLMPMDPYEYYGYKFGISINSLDPEDNASVSSSGLVLNWSGNDKIKGYHLQLSESNDFSGDLVIDDDTLTVTSYTVTQQLEQNHYYYWRIRIKNEEGKWEKWFPILRFWVIGPFISDDFETNDGSFSTLNNWTLGGDELPFVQSTTVHGGNWAAQFGDIDDYGESYFETIAYFATNAIISFYFSGQSDSGEFYFFVDSTEEYEYNCSSQTSWIQISIFIEPGTHKLKWKQEKHYGNSRTATMWIDDINLSGIESFINDDLETNDGSFSTLNKWYLGGDGIPFVQSMTVHGGSWAAQFGNIDDCEESFFEVYSSFPAYRTIRFWVLTDTENCCDRLEVFVDTTQQMNIAPTTWTQYSLSVPEGLHSIKWKYNKDCSVSSGQDTIWIDDITIE